MKKKLLVIATLSIAAAVVLLWLDNRETVETSQVVSNAKPAKLVNTPVVISVRPKRVELVRRCEKGGKKRGHPVTFMHGEKFIWEKPAKDVMLDPGVIPILKGRHKGGVGLPLIALINSESGAMRNNNGPVIIEVTPCTGPSKRYMRGDLQGLGSNGLLLTISPRGILKLMDMRSLDGKNAIKNIHAIRIRDGSGQGGGSGRGGGSEQR